MRWAIVNLETNLVENVIIWDGTIELPYDVNSLIQLNENERCAIGYLYQPTEQIRFNENITSGGG